MLADITTPRLRLRPLATKDAADLFTIRTNEEVHQQMVTPVWSSVQEAEDWILVTCSRPQSNWLSIELLTPSPSQVTTVIGVIGLNIYDALSYFLHPDFWGKGYCTEAVRAYMSHIWTWRPDKDAMEGWILEGNEASKRVLEKCGFEYEPVSSYRVQVELEKEAEGELKKAVEGMGLTSRTPMRNDFVRKPICYKVRKTGTGECEREKV